MIKDVFPATGGRLVAKGYVKKNGVDFDDTIAPDIPFIFPFLIIRKITSMSWHVHHADIFTATLNEDIDSELYLRWDSKWYNLGKSPYDLKQSPYLWYEKPKHALKRFRFTQLESSK